MYTNEIITQDYLSNFLYFKKVVLQIPEPKLSIKLQAESWSIINIIEHILAVEQSGLRLSQFDAEDSLRSPSEKINKIKDLTLDFEQKVQAPKPVEPNKARTDYQTMLTEIEAIRLEMLTIGKEKGWDQLVTKFAHPFYGPLTRLEWTYSNIYHIERHIYQIRHIVHSAAKIV